MAQERYGQVQRAFFMLSTDPSRQTNALPMPRSFLNTSSILQEKSSAHGSIETGQEILHTVKPTRVSEDL